MIKEYLYIFAPDGEQNRSVFDQMLIDFPQLSIEERYRTDIYTRSENDIITKQPNNFLEPIKIKHKGVKSLQLKVLKELFDPALLDNVDSPKVFDSTIESDIISMNNLFWM